MENKKFNNGINPANKSGKKLQSTSLWHHLNGVLNGEDVLRYLLDRANAGHCYLIGRTQPQSKDNRQLVACEALFRCQNYHMPANCHNTGSSDELWVFKVAHAKYHTYREDECVLRLEPVIRITEELLNERFFQVIAGQSSYFLTQEAKWLPNHFKLSETIAKLKEKLDKVDTTGIADERDVLKLLIDSAIIEILAQRKTFEDFKNCFQFTTLEESMTALADMHSAPTSGKSASKKPQKTNAGAKRAAALREVQNAYRNGAQNAT